MEALLTTREALVKQLAALHAVLLRTVRNDELCTRFMGIPGVGPVTALAFSFGFIVLAITAAGEEKRLLLSRFGADYHRYMNRAGRFLPVWRGSNG